MLAIAIGCSQSGVSAMYAPVTNVPISEAKINVSVNDLPSMIAVSELIVT